MFGRFRSFIALEYAVRNEAAALDCERELPPLPPKRYFGNRALAFIESAAGRLLVGVSTPFRRFQECSTQICVL